MKGRIITVVCLCIALASACSTAPSHEPVDDLFAGFNPGSKAASSHSNAVEYLSVITQVIQSHMSEPERFSGKTCDLKINLDREGKVTSVIAVDGDPPLCGAGIKAVKAADIPAPPDEQTYQAFKVSIIEFKPL